MRTLFFCFLLVMFCLSPVHGLWHTEPVAGSAMGKHNSMAIDSSGFLHICSYDRSDNMLVYIVQTVSGWTFEPVAQSGIQSSMVLDSLGNPHICYHDSRHRNLCYAHRTSTGWQFETVSEFGEDPAIALDSQGIPSVTWSSWTEILFATRTDSGWSHESVELSENCGQPTLALDTSDRPHIAYSINVDHFWTQALRMAIRSDTGWQISTVDNDIDGISNPIMVLSSGDCPHIIYDTHDGLRYAHRENDEWLFEDTDERYGYRYDYSLVLDKYDQPQMSYWFFDYYDPAWAKYQIRYGCRDEGGWHFEVLEGDTHYWVGEDDALVLNADGFPRICYRDISNNKLRVAQFDGSNWQFKTVGTEGEPGRSNAVAPGPDGSPIIAYTDGGALRVARQVLGEWVSEIVETDAVASTYNISIKTDRTGAPHLAYFKYVADSPDTKYESRYAWKQDDVWTIETVSQGSEWGSVSLALDADEVPHLTWSTAGIEYAYRGSSGWVRETVVPYAPRFHPDIAVDASGCVHICFVDKENDLLQYASRNSSGWQLETVTTGLTAHNHPSLALDSQDRPHLTCHGRYNEDYYIFYVVREDDGWRIRWAAETRYSTYSASDLVLDSRDQPRICYKCSQKSYILSAWRDGDGWHEETIESVAEYFSDLCCAVDEYGRTHLSYYDLKLKYAVETPPECDALGVSIEMPADFFEWNDLCSCKISLCNPSPETMSKIPLFVIFETAGLFYFAPGFGDFDCYTVDLPPGSSRKVILEEFKWPYFLEDPGSMTIYAGLTDPDFSRLIGELGTWKIHWE